MSAPIPTQEPTSARAGDTWRWRRALSDYPAPAWVLTYTLYASTGVLAIVAAADGPDHLVDVAPATTADYVAGRYDWVAHVSDGIDRFQVGAGSLQILPDVAQTATYDGRSHARKMLDAINALLEGRATTGDLDVVKTAIGANQTDWDLPSLMKLRQQYAAAVAAEDAASSRASGQVSGFVQQRF